MNRSSEVKVGAIVIIAILILAAVGYYVMGPGRVGDTYELRIYFQDAQGLTGGEPVRMAGVQIGEVREISLENGRAVVTIAVKRGIRLYNNYVFSISSGALVPERYIDVAQGDIKYRERQLQPGNMVKGVGNPSVQDIMNVAHSVLSRLDQVAAGVNSILGDPHTVKATKETLANLEIATRAAALTMINLQRASIKGAPNLAKATEDIARATGEAASAISSLSSKIKNSSTPEEIAAAAKAANETMQHTRAISAKIDAMLSDPTWQGDVRVGLSNLRQMTENLNETSKDLRDITKSSAPHIKSITERADKLLHEAGELKDRLKPPQVTPRFDFLVAPHESRSFTDVNFDLAFAGEKRAFYRLGVADIGEENQVNLQAGTHSGRSNLRYGLVRSKLGVGADLGIGNKARLSLDVFDPNRLRADVTAQYPLGRQLGGWDLIFGVRDAFGEDLGFVGTRFGR